MIHLKPPLEVRMNMSQWSWWNKLPELKYHGLNNHGATDYLNSVLQVLFMTEKFREAINRCSSSNNEHIDHHLKELFAELQQRSAYTFNILRALEVSNVNVQQDAAEYFERIVRKTSQDAAKIFHGQLSHRTTCSVCQTVTDSEGPFWHLPLDLEGGENYSVENGIKMFFTPTIFDGENKMYCDRCDTKVDADRKYVITHHPDVLLLLLKRFDFSYKYMSYIKITCNAEVPHSLRIPENQTYELYAVVEHSGNLRSGHYIAIIKSNDDDGWYIFNDSSVTPLGSNPFPDNVNIAQSTDAYLLFYKRKNSVIIDVPSDLNQGTTQDWDQSQLKENLQEGDSTDTLHENVSHIDNRAQNDGNEGIKDSSLIEAKPEFRDSEKRELNYSGEIEKEINSENGRSDEQRSTEGQTGRKKQTEERGQDETRSSYSQDLAGRDAEMGESVGNTSFLMEKDKIQGPDPGKTEAMKFGITPAAIDYDNCKDSAILDALQRQNNLGEVQGLKEESTDEGKQIEVKWKHEVENSNTESIQVQDAGAVDDGENSKLFLTNDLRYDSEKAEQISLIQPNIHSDKNQPESPAPNEEEKQNNYPNVSRPYFNEDYQRRIERTDDGTETQREQTGRKDKVPFHPNSPNVDESRERNQKVDQSHMPGSSGKIKKDQGKNNNPDKTDRMIKGLPSQSEDRHAEEVRQAEEWIKQKAEHSDSPGQCFHYESAEDTQKRYTGKKFHTTHDKKSEFDTERTRKNKNYKLAATLTGNQGTERKEETSQESLLADGSEGLQRAEARGDGLMQTVKVDVREIPSRGDGKKAILVKTIEEETSFNSSRESGRGVSFSATEEAINPCEPLLTEQPNLRSEEVPIGRNKDEFGRNFDGDTELETFQERNNKKKKYSCKCTCVCL